MLDYVLPKPGAATDAQMLQAAVDAASKQGIGRVVIPRCNPRTGKPRYEVDKAVLLPSDIEIILDNCTIGVAEGAMCNIFRNENMYTDRFHKAEGEQKNIIIRGQGHAVLDGTGHNDIFEYAYRLNSARYNIW